jgi:menaquinone-9 beta-reductase
LFWNPNRGTSVKFGMQHRDYDALVVGAGPAGASAAFQLASAGMRVALIEKARFPREKLCGGLLSERAEKVYRGIFGDNWHQSYEFTASGMSFYYKTRWINELRNYRRLYFTTRSKFDGHLVQMAAGKGARFIDGAGVRHVDPESGVLLLENGDRVTASFIIGADGANSRVARSLGLAIQKSNLAAGLEIDLPREGVRAGLDHPEIHFGMVRWGYGWVFPKKESLTVGIAGLVRKNEDLRANFQHFLEQLFPDRPPIRWKGHPIPFGNFLRQPGKENVLLAGDAAGLVEPVTGEGIAFAMQSGSDAAQAVLQAAEAGTPEMALDLYQARHSLIVRHFGHAKWMRYLVFPSTSERTLARALARSLSMAKQFMNLLAGEMDYMDYLTFLLKGSCRFVLNPHRNAAARSIHL